MARKILLADDSITIQKVVELTFSDGDYEVTAVNNGAKAIQKLSEMRPDIILSDIIMPEKNGYEVCEFVKSHPDFRTIPVILLTGTFEPFDPDRADKAGCDAVVTKPFESQSLIHKVDELIQHARTTSTGPVPVTAPPEPEPAPEPAIEPSPWNEPAEHGADIFSAPTAQQPAPELSMPFEQPAESHAFSMGKFDELPRTGETPMPHAENPWDDTAETPVYGGETRAFPKMSYEELQQTPAHEPEPEHMGHDEMEDRAEIETTPAEAMPWEEPAAEAPAFPPSIEPAPWEEPESSSFAAETRAFPKMSYEELAQTPAHEEPPPEIEPSPWEEPAMPVAESFSSAAVAPFEETPAPPAAEETPFAIEEPATTAEEPLWAPHEAAPSEPEAPPAAIEPAHEEAPAPVAAAAAAAAVSTDLTDEQVDRIARRVVQLMSEQLVRNIAWEVIPDLAEMVVKERIRELEEEGP